MVNTRIYNDYNLTLIISHTTKKSDLFCVPKYPNRVIHNQCITLLRTPNRVFKEDRSCGQRSCHRLPNNMACFTKTGPYLR
ncbi:hypothetical protein M0804_007751 [Polistes exclamans]|nr:hypothetical protein M0804_007751 [Polistes exclamans]